MCFICYNYNTKSEELVLHQKTCNRTDRSSFDDAVPLIHSSVCQTTQQQRLVSMPAITYKNQRNRPCTCTLRSQRAKPPCQLLSSDFLLRVLLVV
jgi:hypothetical protein